ncbi:MAG: LacI family transcriptional regulator [Lachnospiraceae bacterium]|nr:LacI family transcriptional regulator [Lachnospiraceae bacterium]
MNIYDIAKLAGVSIATVSRVVNDSPKVSEKTKTAVLKIMEENNYTPNVFARGLGLGSMKSVGIVCPDVADAYMAKAVSYLEKNLRGYGYDCILYCSSYDDEDKRQAVELIFKKQIDALILVGSNYADINGQAPDYVREAALQIPVFLINGYLCHDNIYCVMADDFQSVYDITEELLLAGKKRILFLYNSHSYSAKRKLKGYMDALASHGMEADPELMLYCDSSIYAMRDILLCRRGLVFDSVIAAEDWLAVGAMKYASATGIRVPEAVNIIGYNNSQLSISCTPELSSVDNRVEVLCKTAIDSLMSLLGGQKIPSRQTVKCHLIKRQTTDF